MQTVFTAEWMAGTFAAVRRRRRALQNYRTEKFCWQTRRCRTMLTSTINCRYDPTVFIGKYVLLSDSSSICVDFWGAHCDKCRSCAHTENLQQKEPAEPCWILPLSLHETLTLTLCLHDSAKLQKMPLHPQKPTVTLVTLCSLQAEIPTVQVATIGKMRVFWGIWVTWA